MDTITVITYGGFEWQSFKRLLRSLESELPEYQIRSQGVAADIPSFGEAVVKAIEVGRVVEIMVPWDWTDIAKAFGAGAVAKAGESTAEAGISAAKSLLKTVTVWLKDESRNDGEESTQTQSASTSSVVYILNFENEKVARIELNTGTSEPTLTRVETSTESHS